MRIVHVVSSLDLGGAERLLVDLASEQTRRGHSVLILTLSEGGVLTPVARTAGVMVEEHELRRGTPLARLRHLIRVGRAVRSADHDVMHSWMYHAGLLSVLLAPRRSRVMVSIHHDDPRDDGMGRATRLIARALGKFARRSGSVVYVSESARSNHLAAGYPVANATVIPGGVDAERFHPMASDVREARRTAIDPGAGDQDAVVVHLSRYHPDKDPGLMISAFATARAQHGSLRLWMIGRGMDRDNEDLVQIIADHGVGDAVVLLGPLDAPATVIAAGDIIAVSSRTESFGLALIEGMLSGLAGASTHVGIAAMLLPPDQISKPEDPVGLAQALLRAASRSDAESHRTAAMAFGLESMSDQFDTLYAIVRRDGLTTA